MTIRSHVYINADEDGTMEALGLDGGVELEPVVIPLRSVIGYSASTGKYPGTHLMLTGGHLAVIEMPFEDFDAKFGPRIEISLDL